MLNALMTIIFSFKIEKTATLFLHYYYYLQSTSEIAIFVLIFPALTMSYTIYVI